MNEYTGVIPYRDADVPGGCAAIRVGQLRNRSRGRVSALLFHLTTTAFMALGADAGPSSKTKKIRGVEDCGDEYDVVSGHRPHHRLDWKAGKMISGPEQRMHKAVCSPKRILLVDDDRELCDQITLNSVHLNCEIVVCHSANDAVSLMDENHFSLILLDLNLKNGMNGVALYKHFSGLKKTNRIVIFTGEIGGPLGNEILKLKAPVYALKPDLIDEEYMERMLAPFGIVKKA